MKNTILIFIAIFTCGGFFGPVNALAQNGDVPDPTLVKPPHIIFQVGVSSQWLGGNNWRSTVFSIEHPFGLYEHLGVDANFILPNYTDNQYYSYYSFDRQLSKGSYEVGLFYKIFLHGRLTGRKSNLYVAPELKFGRRNFKQKYYNDVYPLPNTPSEIHFHENTTKFVFRVGAQYKIGPAILEIALPIAIEKFKTINPATVYNSYNYNGTNTHLLLLPCLQLGIAF
ncbi:MAG: hypothetical protein WCR52_02030 [Bacteroidota bacterium]